MQEKKLSSGLLCLPQIHFDSHGLLIGLVPVGEGNMLVLRASEILVLMFSSFGVFVIFGASARTLHGTTRGPAVVANVASTVRF